MNPDTDMLEGVVLVTWFEQTARELNTRFPNLCDADELHRLLDASIAPRASDATREFVEGLRPDTRTYYDRFREEWGQR